MLFTNASTSSARTCAGTETIARASFSARDRFVAVSTPSEKRRRARRERGDQGAVRGREPAAAHHQARLEAPRHRPLAERLEHLRDDDGDDGRDEPDVVAERVRGRAHGGRHIANRGALARDEARREARVSARRGRSSSTRCSPRFFQTTPVKKCAGGRAAGSVSVRHWLTRSRRI